MTGEMNTSLGRNGLIGLAVGATTGIGLIAFIIYRGVSRRRSQGLAVGARPAPLGLRDSADGALLMRDALDEQGECPRSALPGTTIIS